MAFSVGPTCDDGTPWKLCIDACKKASCTKNPEAKCVAPMGGCGPDACKPKFYDSMGREVQCKLSWHQNEALYVVRHWYSCVVFALLFYQVFHAVVLYFNRLINQS